MIKSIEVVNFLGGVENESKVIELGAPETSGLWVKSIKGIGPGKANINTTDMASSDGGIFNSARSEVRNITMTLGIVDYVDAGGKYHSLEEVRRNTYKWFGKKNQLKIIFHTDQIHLYTYGFVESNEPDIFNKQETTSISIICPDPNFYNNNGDSEIQFSALVDVFEFPIEFVVTSDTYFHERKEYYELIDDEYILTSDVHMIQGKTYYEEVLEDFGYENLSVDQEIDEWTETTDTKFLPGKEYYERTTMGVDPNTYYLYTLTNDTSKDETKTYYEYYNRTEFGTLNEIGEKDILYKGEIDIGVQIIVHFSDEVTGFNVYKINPELGTTETISIDDLRLASVVGSGFVTGDTLYISTVQGQKSAFLYRNNEYYNVMNSLGTNPDWLQLTKGRNTFSYSADTGAENVSLYIRYKQAYEGL